MEIQKKEKVHCLQNQIFHIFFGPMGLGETLANFFRRFGKCWEVWKSRRKKKYIACKTKFSHFFWAYGPRGNSREFFLEVLGSDGKSMEINTHKKNQCFLGTVSFLYRGKRQKHHHSSPFLIRCMKFLSENV